MTTPAAAYHHTDGVAPSFELASQTEQAMAESVEKLEDVVVRSAEQVAGQIRAAKDAISTVIFGQDRVIENTLVTILSGGHALLIGVPGLAKTKLVETCLLYTSDAADE